jgi:3-hydroxyisobutyrate dehydrogenase-like beta-hydroxyacid dehydrogenase
MAKSSKSKSKSARKSGSSKKKSRKTAAKASKAKAKKTSSAKAKSVAKKASSAKASGSKKSAKKGGGSDSKRRRSRSKRRRTKIGFIGQGLMGVPMALRLLQAGFSLQVWNRTPEKAKETVEAGGTFVETPAAAAKGADVVILMVSDDAALDAVLFGEQGASRGLKRGAVVVNCSTTSPTIAFRAATALRSLSVRYLEAPVMRSVHAAREGQLQILVGGKEEDLEKARKVLETLGSDIHHVGDVGKAATLKLACNVLLACMTQAFAEYFVLARKNGVPFETMMEVLHAGPLDSAALRDSEQIVVNPGGRPNFFLRHMHNDLNLAMELAQQLDVPVPLTAATRQLLSAAENVGLGNADCGALVDLMSKWSGVAMRG